MYFLKMVFKLHFDDNLDYYDNSDDDVDADDAAADDDDNDKYNGAAGVDCNKEKLFNYNKLTTYSVNQSITSSNDSFDSDARSVDFFGELVDGSCWVLVCVWIDIALSAAV